MKATLFLRREHESMRLMLDQIRKPSRGNDKIVHVEQLRQEMEIHQRLEQELFYPELLNTPSVQAAALVREAMRRHEEIDNLLRDFSQHYSPKKADSQLVDLAKKVIDYFNFEEDAIFEEARQTLSEFRMEQLGLDMEVRRRLLTTTAA